MEKNFLKKLAAAFGVSSNGTRSSVIVYGEEASMPISLQDHNNTQAFWDATDAIKVKGTSYLQGVCSISTKRSRGGGYPLLA